MPSKCPNAPLPNSSLVIQTEILPAGTKLWRFHGSGTSRPGNLFNPNTGKDWTKPLDGARFNPFPDSMGVNVPHLYCADTFKAAALESVFHEVRHKKGETFPRLQFSSWQYSEILTKEDILLFRLTNPELRQLEVPGRDESLNENEMIHSLPDEYPNTRTWAQHLFLSAKTLQGLAWRPRLGGQGSAFVLFGPRCDPAGLPVVAGPTRIDTGIGYDKIMDVAIAASIRVISS